MKNLDSVLFLSGRIATQKDRDEKKAIFVINPKGLEHTHIDIQLPAYAYHKDQETGEHTKVIVVQAERVGEQEIAGLRYLDDREGACYLWELEFLD